jgi:hypothetical protein
MARNQPDFSDAQRAACLRAVVHGGMSRRAASTAAQNGELGLPAFSISPSTISNFVQAERDRQRAELRAEDGYDDPDGLQARLEDLDEALLSMAEQVADELLESDEPIDLNRARELIYVAKILKQVLRANASSGRQSRGQEQRTSSLLERLAANAGPEGNSYGDPDDDPDNGD